MADQQQWIIQGPMVGRLMTHEIYLESFQSCATLRLIAEPGRATSFSRTACAASELRDALGYVFDHFDGQSKYIT